MELMDAVKARHAVRQYENKPLEPEIVQKLEEEIAFANAESGLHIQLVKNEPKAFDGFMAHYGKFEGVTNYLALVGKKGPKFEETCGYYGEKLVLKAQQWGLNSCWVAMTYKKIPNAFQVGKGEKLAVVIALGYGKTQGVPHKVKTPEQVSNLSKETSDWFHKGVSCALLAPTALNQQKFRFVYQGDKVIAKPGVGFYSKVDLGIAKYHFEIGAGKSVDWVEE